MVNWLNNIIEGILSGYKFNLLKEIVEILLKQANVLKYCTLTSIYMENCSQHIFEDKV